MTEFLRSCSGRKQDFVLAMHAYKNKTRVSIPVMQMVAGRLNAMKKLQRSQPISPTQEE